MIASEWFTGRRLAVRRRLEVVPCTVEVEHTAEFLHAHVDLLDVDIRPGDSVIVADPPTQVEFGERVVCQRRATVMRAGVIQRLWTRFAGHLELTELYEVSFSSRRTP